MIAAIVPAHDEAQRVGDCLQSLARAARHPALEGEPVRIIVVLDDCTDATGVIARRSGARTVSIHARNVGVARATGASLALTQGARWLAFTDADTRVADDWLAAQLHQACDAVCGTVEVSDWHEHSAAVRRAFDANYQDRDGHRHIHGANLGVSARAYRRARGFPPHRSHEDVALVQALQRVGATIAWSSAPRVVTSARLQFKAPEGFGATLARLPARMMEMSP